MRAELFDKTTANAADRSLGQRVEQLAQWLHNAYLKSPMPDDPRIHHHSPRCPWGELFWWMQDEYRFVARKLLTETPEVLR